LNNSYPVFGDNLPYLPSNILDIRYILFYSKKKTTFKEKRKKTIRTKQFKGLGDYTNVKKNTTEK